MSSDPFLDDDKTILRHTMSAKARPTFNTDTAGHFTHDFNAYTGINVLEQAAAKLLTVLSTVGQTINNPDPKQLHESLSAEVRNFQLSITHLSIDHNTCTAASYVLCTALDEAILNTPWGGDSGWSQNSLLSNFHNEVAGGKKFFELLKQRGKDPAHNVELLELMQICLALGYQGQYRVEENGADTLVRVRQWLHSCLTTVTAAPQILLSSQWQGENTPLEIHSRSLPWWAAIACAFALVSVVFYWLLIRSADLSETTVASIKTLTVEPLAIVSITPPEKPLIIPSSMPNAANTLPQNLSELLAKDISSGKIEVIEKYDRGRIRVLGDQLFPSGRPSLSPKNIPLFLRIGQAIGNFNRQVVVSGHTDSIPISNARYPTNAALSLARARSIANIFTQLSTAPTRFVVEGNGSSNPIASNKTPQGRAQNRRVEITVFY